MNVLLSVILLCFTVNAWAGIGTVIDNKGTACEIQRDKSKLPGLKGAEIETMDTYTTVSCVGNIKFKDDTTVRVTENSRLLIDDFVYDPKKSDAGKLAIKAALGTVRYTSGQIAKNNPQQVNVKTPTASVAVRGTDFTMTVDEAGQSLVVLVPSCKDEKDVKQFEMDEQKCRVGSITVSTNAGSVDLDKAFEATYVSSSDTVPTPPIVLFIVESKINNTLILVKPQEIQRAIDKQQKSRKDQEEDDAELEAQRQINRRIEQAKQTEEPKVLQFTFVDGKRGCNPATSICFTWENPDGATVQDKGKGTAIRKTQDHYAEVKTLGYISNSTITMIQDDVADTAILGSGDPNGNIIYIKQNSGVLRK